MKKICSIIFALAMLFGLTSQAFADEYVNGVILYDYDSPPERLLDSHDNELGYQIKYTLTGSTKHTTTANVSVTGGFKDAFSATCRSKLVQRRYTY